MKRENTIIILVTTCFLLAGCVGSLARPLQRQAIFIEDEYAPYAGKGTSSITGQAFLKTRGGDIKLGAGNTIYLRPVTSYSTEWFDKQVMLGRHLSERDMRAGQYDRSTIADANSNFEFKNLPAGEYYIATTIKWKVPRRRGGGLTTTGSNVGAQVRVVPGETVKVILTR